MAMPVSTGFGAAASERRSGYRAAVVGASAGGLAALQGLLQAVPEDFCLPLIAVLHTASDGAADLARVLGPHTHLKVQEARERSPVMAGCLYLAPGRYHLLVEQDAHFSLSVDPRVRYARPSIDVLFESAAEAYRSGLIGLVLTGGNDDGAAGLARIKSLGGYAMVQAPAQAQIATMPQAAIAAAQADYVADIADLGARLGQLARGGANVTSTR